MNVTVVSNVVCENCVSNHRSFECQDGGPYEANSSEQVNYVANNQRQYNPSSNYFNQWWKNHPNFSWSNNANVKKPPSNFQSQEKKPNLEEVFTQFIQKTNDFIDDTKANFRNQGASIRSLEHQVGEISKLLMERTQWALPSITETNPKEHVKTITLRSRKELEQSNEAEQQENKKDTLVPKEQVAFTPIQPSTPKPSSNATHFPQRLKKQNLDKQFSKFIDILRAYISIFLL